MRLLEKFLVTFGKYTSSYDGAYFLNKAVGKDEQKTLFNQDEQFPMYNSKDTKKEEWPSEVWNYQDKFSLKSIKNMEVNKANTLKDSDESALNVEDVSDDEMFAFLSTSAKGFGKKKAQAALEIHGKEKLMNMLESEPNKLLDIKKVSKRKL